MTITYRYRIDDYIQAFTFHTIKNLVRYKAIFVIAGIVFIAVFLLPSCNYYLPKRIIIAGIVGGFAGVLSTYFIYPFFIKRQIKQNTKVLLAEVEIALTDNGISLISELGTSHLQWENLYRWRKNKQFLLLYTTSSMYHIIPTHLAEQGLDTDKIIEKLTETMGKPS